ncbi:MAG: c-type cytochrome [Gammaproteobacteria bacterium]|nr:c-type cytochrome [Gammaproteobacteria bacterium]
MQSPLSKSIGPLLIAAVVLGSPLGFASNGATLYHDYCSVCHGERGDGRSRARGSMVPPPRDFTTPAAAVELNRERMIDAVVNGRPGTAMAPWADQLDQQQVAEVVDYIRQVLMLPIATETAEEARRLYAENCSVCHGDDGRGARWTLRNMQPPPKNFTLPEVAEQLDRDYMLRTVAHGKANTAMPGFATQLSDEQIATVVDYVRGAFMRTGTGAKAQQQPAAMALKDTRFPDGLEGDFDSGMAFYIANCSTCHGVYGDGKGPRAYFILPKPRDFRHPAARNGLDRARLYTAIAEGTRGTEMPAWDKVLTPQEIANVAEYVYQAFIASEDGDGKSVVR